MRKEVTHTASGGTAQDMIDDAKFSVMLAKLFHLFNVSSFPDVVCVRRGEANPTHLVPKTWSLVT